jgi:DNA-binding transcriptional MerR regulator
MSDVRYGIAELAELGGVSRRTVRYYVQEGLLPAPFGVGRGDHYGPAHLARLEQVRSLQEAGLSLDDIRHRLDDARAMAAAAPAVAAPAAARAVVRETWRRLTLAPGVELHLGADVPLPSAAGMQELAAWCRRPLAHRELDRED